MEELGKNGSTGDENNSEITLNASDSDNQDEEETTRKLDIIEPVFFLIFIAVSMSETVIVNVIEQQYCRHMLNISDEECFNTSSPYETRIQQFTAKYQTTKIIAESFLPGILTFFLGPWSDVYGRKPLMYISMIGFIISFSLWTWFTTFYYISPLYFFICCVPIALTGGTASLSLASFCYLSDVTTIETRGFRMGIFQAVQMSGILIGSFSTYLVSITGYTPIFATTTALFYIALIYVYFFTRESVVPQELDEGATLITKNPFHTSHLRELYDACYTKQTPRTRITILVMLGSLILSQTIMNGEFSVTYLFMQHVYGWTLEDYTLLNAISIITSAVCTTSMLWLFSHRLMCHDLLVISGSLFMRLVSALLMIPSSTLFEVYFCRFLGAFGNAINPLSRAFLSNVIPPDDIGKVFSLLSSGESVAPTMGSLLYSMVYTNTLETMPTAIYIASSVVLLNILFMISIMVHVHIPTRSSRGASPLNATPDNLSIN